MFKELKQKFHHKNVYIMSQLINYLPKVNVIPAPSKLHLDWDKYLDRLYKRPAAGTINKNHIFREDQGQFSVLTTESIKGTDVQSQNLNKIKTMSIGASKAGRTRILKYGKVELIKAPGLKPMKQVNVFKKW